MTPEQAEIVAHARIVVVRKFRHKEGGYDRPDSPGDPWYKAEEWDDECNYYGPPLPMMPAPVNKAAQGEPELTKPEGTELTKYEKRNAYMREYMKKKRET